MLTHRAIWAAIDGLAERYGLTASGLARKAGLDPTTFNRSKRISRDGKQRWTPRPRKPVPPSPA